MGLWVGRCLGWVGSPTTTHHHPATHHHLPPPQLKDGVGLRNLAIQNFAENGINNPLLYFPIFYTIQEFLKDGVDMKPMNGLRKVSQPDTLTHTPLTEYDHQPHHHNVTPVT